MNFSTTNPFQSRELLPFAEAVRESRRAKGHCDDDIQQHFLVVLTLDDNGHVIDLDAPIVSQEMPLSSSNQKRISNTARSSKKQPAPAVSAAAPETVMVEHDENIR